MRLSLAHEVADLEHPPPERWTMTAINASMWALVKESRKRLADKRKARRKERRASGGRQRSGQQEITDVQTR
jgi:hypothetical protein